MRKVSAEKIKDFRARIWAHYRRHGRQMPWRETRDPYRILVSEIMLQQTQVERVRAKYEEFLTLFPDVATLDRAPRDRVLAAWQGLGYNRRALALKKTARLLLTEHGGRIPDNPTVLATFPGIGAATAAAICAFAFNAPVVFVETNIRRVFIHEFFPRRDRVADSELLPLIASALDRRRSRQWYQALMDYGSALAARVPNPNLRSRSYRRQSGFEGSDRQVRGALVRALLRNGATTTGVLAQALGVDLKRVRRLLVVLESEGFVQRDGRRVRIAQRDGRS